VDVYKELSAYNINVDMYDPWANIQEVKAEYGISLISEFNAADYQGVLVAVSHSQFLEINFASFKNNNAVVFDTKAILDRSLVDARL